MGIGRVASRAQLGLEAPRVVVEVHLGGGLPNFSIVGLPATVVKESKDRVRAALANAEFEWPAGRITVNLSPADLPKDGCRYDLPIALGILQATGQLKVGAPELAGIEFYGELGLEGELKPIRGVLLAAAHAAREGHRILVPAANLAEARIVAKVRAQGAGSLQDVCARLASRETDAVASDLPAAVDAGAATGAGEPMDLADVRGQAAPKRALLVAAAGAHSLLMVGPPGTGKSMLAQRLPGLLPPLDGDDALEVASIASVSTRGFEPRHFGRRPFRAPHHSASAGAIIGGGPLVRPGELSLAHRGVLFLDELPEFDRRVLESLREPMESGVVAISRASRQVEYPARFQLVAAMNPCPCGFLGDGSGRCRCAPPAIARYRSRISGPLLDRIDLRVEVPVVPDEDLLGEAPRDPVLTSQRVAERVRDARLLQMRRAGKLNTELTGRQMSEVCRLDSACRRLLAHARGKLELSARAVHRVLRVARTVADLEAAPAIAVTHLAEALQLRRSIS